jgi:O-antigen/teichoic acid export membrane protein
VNPKSTIWKGSLLNVMGQIIPSLAYGLAVPSLIGRLGVERFGVFSLVWIFYAYVSLFDFGIGRGTARAVAGARGSESALASFLCTSLCLVSGLGATAATILWGVAPAVAGLVRVDPALRPEVVHAFRLAAAALPFFLVVWVLQSAVEGLQRFADLAAARAVTGLTTGAAVSLAASLGLSAALMALVITRLLYGVLLLRILVPLIGITKARWRFDRSVARELLVFGRWAAVHALLGPVLVYGDRLLLAGLHGPREVSLYAIPQDTIVRLMLFPAAVAMASFPLLSSRSSSDSFPFVQRVVTDGLLLVGGLLGPAAVVLALFPSELLHLWIGPGAQGAAAVLRLLSFGALAFGYAHVPSAALMALGRPDIPAKVSAGLLIPFLLTATLVAKAQGAPGVAIVWSLRALLQLVLYVVALRRLLGGASSYEQRASVTSACLWLGGCCALMVVTAGLSLPASARVLLCGVAALMGLMHLRFAVRVSPGGALGRGYGESGWQIASAGSSFEAWRRSR